MTQDTEHRLYRGVKCLHCTQPIPISPFVACIDAEFQNDEITLTKQRKCQVFNLRCVACGKERPYKIAEILDFEDVLANLMPHVEPTPAQFHQSGNKSRAAGA